MQRKFSGLTPMSLFVQKLTQATLLRRGIHRHRILLDWQTIVGDKLADLSCPLRITRPQGPQSGGTLHLQVLSGASLLIDSSKDLICERINRHYGYRIVERLKIIQTPKLGRLQQPIKRKPVEKTKEVPVAPDLLKTMNEISDLGLQAALKDFLDTFHSRNS